MTDNEIKKVLGIPHTTLWTWKNRPIDDYRNVLYSLLRSMTIEEFYSFIGRTNLDFLLKSFREEDEATK